MYDQLCSWENLLLAYRRASAGKRGRLATATFEHLLEENLLQLRRELRDRTYLPGSYHSFYVHDPKRRLISAAPFRARVVHHALCNVIEPVLERSFIFHSYANRLGKGTHRALDYAQKLARRFPYVLQCDVQQFFHRIDLGILRETLARHVSDEGVRGLIDRILGGNKLGLPLGNLTSQLWGNTYMSPFDHFVTRELRCDGYLRYVDDFLLFGRDKNTLWRFRDAVVDRLSRLKLTLHPGLHPRPVTEGFPFLGFVVFPERRRLKRRKVVHFRRKIKALMVEQADTKAAVDGWVNHVRYANTVGLRKKTIHTLGVSA